MLFEVFNEKGSRVFYTEHEGCLPAAAQIKQMQKTGYTFKVDGKRWRPEKQK